jgi:adenylosuccinate synthase
MDVINNSKFISSVDICCGLAWGDEGKGKIVSYLSKTGNYDFVCRWGGGNNAGHTIYKNGKKYKTHLIPSGVFYGVKSVIGPNCVVNIDAFYEELKYLKLHGFDTSLVRVSPLAHIITGKHIEEDKNKYNKQLGTTAKGIAPCYRDKYGRTGRRVCDVLSMFEGHIWDGKLWGKILCEGAQGFWLDVDYGNYPYNTSSQTLPYSACSLGFPPQYIKKIFGAAKVYDTRSGTDPEFPEELLLHKELMEIGMKGNECGTTTGRRRKVQFLDLEKLIKAIQISGTTILILSKMDVLEDVNIFKIIDKTEIVNFDNALNFKTYIRTRIENECQFIQDIIFSYSMEEI